MLIDAKDLINRKLLKMNALIFKNNILNAAKDVNFLK